MTSWKRFAIVFAAVFLGNLATFGVVLVWMDHQTRALAQDIQRAGQEMNAGLQRAIAIDQAQAEAARKAAEQARAQQRQAQDAAARKAEDERQRAARAAQIERETCATWRRFYANERTEYNRLMMERSCVSQ